MRIAVVLLTLAAAVLGFYFWHPFAIASFVATNDEINACAVMIAQHDYRREYNWATKTWMPDVRSVEDANQSLIVDEGERPDLIAAKIAYERRFSIPTVYTGYVTRGAKLCLQKKMRGEKVEMPTLNVRHGWRVIRRNGSAALVKDGEPEPQFWCVDGYRPSGFGCIKN